MKSLFVKPREGILVRVPETGRHLPSDVTRITLTQFMARRLRDGDLIQSLPPTETEGGKAKEN